MTCLVACQQGVSRSASLVIAYVMAERGVGVEEAYEFVKERSSVVGPNVEMMGRLREFEGFLRGEGLLPAL
ncbi:Protein transport protein ssh1 [Irineochytrium annulatum]|nr:Protein transport protein ssh1 [Irineochytrium annulatum]